jgi:hypothetical protein
VSRAALVVQVDPGHLPVADGDWTLKLNACCSDVKR